MRIRDCSSDVCSSDLKWCLFAESDRMWRTWLPIETAGSKNFVCMMLHKVPGAEGPEVLLFRNDCKRETAREVVPVPTGIEIGPDRSSGRSEEHTSELQSLMRISYAVFCLKKKPNLLPV